MARIPYQLLLLAVVVTLSGCAGDTASDTTNDSTSSAQAAGAQPNQTSPDAEGSTDDAEMEFRPLTMNSLGGEDSAASGSASASSGEQRIRDVIDRLKPLQALLGDWRGTTRKEYDDFKAVDTHEWVWDLKSDPTQPGLVLESDKSPYIRRGRITWRPEDQAYFLTAVDADGVSRDLKGAFTDAVHEELMDDDKYHKVFRIEFNQEAGNSPEDELWQLAFVKQETNRYLLEVGKRRGNARFSRFDVVSTQREGTSFALSDSDYKERTCVISEGLGTISVSYKGRSYWVCCTGCKAAFEEDPEKWIAMAAKRAEKK
ncbi:MAG: hypothetical protein KDA96_03060 [Planctomycetaceae bacterium]|nr:hypothetical protein [Planctomycetaceae bacterium]